jgi:hypothetical protein
MFQGDNGREVTIFPFISDSNRLPGLHYFGQVIWTHRNG